MASFLPLYTCPLPINHSTIMLLICYPPSLSCYSLRLSFLNADLLQVRYFQSLPAPSVYEQTREREGLGQYIITRT